MLHTKLLFESVLHTNFPNYFQLQQRHSTHHHHAPMPMDSDSSESEPSGEASTPRRMEVWRRPSHLCLGVPSSELTGRGRQCKGKGKGKGTGWNGIRRLVSAVRKSTGWNGIRRLVSAVQHSQRPGRRRWNKERRNGVKKAKATPPAAAAACTVQAQGGMEAGRPAGSDTKLEARDGSQSQITHWRTLKSADLL